MLEKQMEELMDGKINKLAVEWKDKLMEECMYKFKNGEIINE